MPTKLFFSFNYSFKAFNVFYFIYEMYTRCYFLFFLICLTVTVFFKNMRFGGSASFSPPKKRSFTHHLKKTHIVIFVLITKSDRRPTDVFGSGRAPRDINVKQVCSHDMMPQQSIDLLITKTSNRPSIRLATIIKFYTD